MTGDAHAQPGPPHLPSTWPSPPHHLSLTLTPIPIPMHALQVIHKGKPIPEAPDALVKVAEGGEGETHSYT